MKDRQTPIRNEEKIKTKKVQLKKVDGGRGRETHSIVKMGRKENKRHKHSNWQIANIGQ